MLSDPTYLISASFTALPVLAMLMAFWRSRAGGGRPWLIASLTALVVTWGWVPGARALIQGGTTAAWVQTSQTVQLTLGLPVLILTLLILPMVALRLYRASR